MKVSWKGLSHILWKIKNVPNHKPDTVYHPLPLNMGSVLMPPFIPSVGSTSSPVILAAAQQFKPYAGSTRDTPTSWAIAAAVPRVLAVGLL
jgi:hypothetical protein